MKTIFQVLMIGIAGLCLAPTAQAQFPGACCMQGGITGFYFNDGGLRNRLPHFALHPPVYYSYPVPRTYGYSPFAYPGTVRTPEVELVGPQEIINPYVSPETQEVSADKRDQTAVQTVKPEIKPETREPETRVAVIINPYVEQSAVLEARLNRSDVR